jgi:Peptidase family C25
MNPYNDSLSEMLIKYNNGGASMVWASTGLTTPDVQLVMASRFFNQIGAGSITRAGDLVKDAKTMVPGGLDVRLSWALIGDPMLKVRP